MEKMLTDIWAKVLDRDHIGIRDNFFDAGGNSLLIMKVFAELKQKIDFPLTSVQLFQYTTIERLADFLEDRA